MPYACSMVGGRPLLTPAPEQGHRIVGQREQRTHTACSPVNPEQCRNWTVHRFMLDCEGSRVPWVSVVASVAEETTRRAWIEGGRLVVRMPASWSFEPGDPCARQPGFDDRFGFGRMRRYCADRRAMAPPPIVEMPAGFAPLLGIDGIFVKSSGPSTSPPPPLPPPVASAPPAPPPKVARSEPPQPPARAEPMPLPAARPEPPSSADAAAPSAPPPKVAVQPSPQAAPAAPVAKAPPAPAPAAAPPIAAPSGPVIPKIINRPESATTDVAEQMRPAPTTPRAAPPATEVPKSAGNPIPSQDTGRREIPPAGTSTGRRHPDHRQPAQHRSQPDDRRRRPRGAGARLACSFCFRPAARTAGRHAPCTRHRIRIPGGQTRPQSHCPPSQSRCQSPPNRSCAAHHRGHRRRRRIPLQRSAHRLPGSTEFLKRELKHCRYWAWAFHPMPRKRP